MKNHIIGFFVLFCFSNFLWAHPTNSNSNSNSKNLMPILGDLVQLKSMEIPILVSDESSGVGFTYITPEMEIRLHQASHLLKRCGPFQSLEGMNDISISSVQDYFLSLNQMNLKNELYSKGPFEIASLNWNQDIQDSIDQIQELEITNWIKWISSFPTRYNKAADPNKHVFELKTKLENLVQSSSLPITISTIDHVRTKQKTLRAHIEGKTRPNEIIVLGGHFDSISNWGGGPIAPGADDNASGSADLLEAFRILISKSQPERSIEFFWYAGEESGLLGSTEIADEYKKNKKNVIAVLQLDMTLFPGNGEFVIGNVTDFTSAWLRDYLKSMNSTYLKIKLVDDKCGYACSDHASWYRNGYSTLLPFEATLNTMNEKIHSEDDKINSTSDFKHSLVFSKMALIFALDLGNSNLKSPL